MIAVAGALRTPRSGVVAELPQGVRKFPLTGGRLVCRERDVRQNQGRGAITNVLITY
jgi:hypothetical protein